MGFPTQLRALLFPARVGLQTIYTGSSERAAEAITQEVTARGKPFTKIEAVYTPLSPVPPIAWMYTCANCRFWKAPEAAQDASKQQYAPIGTCAIVDGKISGTGWCGFWTPKPDDKPYAWISRLRQEGIGQTVGGKRERRAI